MYNGISNVTGSAAALERRRDRGVHGAGLGVGATSRRGAIHKKGTSPRTIGRAADAPASLTATTTKTAAATGGVVAPRREELRELFGLGAGT